ncbi:MAG TPA: ABC transporter ATP-binding protein [Leptolyngbyaceae cyanobacterium]
MFRQKLLLSFAKQHLKWVILSIILGLSGAIFNGIGTTLIVPAVLQIIDSNSIQSNFDLPPVVQNLVSPFLRAPENYRAGIMLGAIIVAILLKNLANYFSVLSRESLSRQLTRDIRKAGIQLILEVDIDYHNKMRAGDIIQRLNDQVGRAVGSVGTTVSLICTLINILFLICILMAISWKLTILSAVFLSGVVLLNRQVITSSKRHGKALADASREYSIHILEVINGIRLIKATTGEQREYEKLKSLVDNRENAALKSQVNFAFIGPLNEVSSILALVVIVLAGRAIFNDAAISTTVLLTFLFVLSRLIPFISNLNTARSQLANSTASVDFVHDFLRKDNKSFMRNGRTPYFGLKQGIQFENISFQYPGNSNWVLSNVTLQLPKGKTLALVGTSGAGKSTLSELLPRFYDPTLGRITIDGVDLREFDIKTLRRRMGIVSQETFLFNASVRENIAYAYPDATDDDVIQAARRANAYEFIMNLPNGFDTFIGDRGVLLSGGQRQRLAIARALLQDPDILILDEATSALDTVSEQVVQQAIDELSRDRTVLVIAHRLSTIRNADQIVVLENGQVVESGTHTTLVQSNGTYARLHNTQSKRVELRHIQGDSIQEDFSPVQLNA